MKTKLKMMARVRCIRCCKQLVLDIRLDVPPLCVNTEACEARRELSMLGRGR